MVMVWLPELPPTPATIGISAASATSRSIEPSKSPITREAIRAVTRFTASHDQRFLTLCQTVANRSSSSRRPARFKISRSAFARITSTTSSTVMRPRSRWFSSTTGAEMRL